MGYSSQENYTDALYFLQLKNRWDNVISIMLCQVLKHTTVRKVSDFFFCKNLVDFNEARLHEMTLNLHMHTWIFPRQFMASSIWVK